MKTVGAPPTPKPQHPRFWWEDQLFTLQNSEFSQLAKFTNAEGTAERYATRTQLLTLISELLSTLASMEPGP